MEDTSIIVFLKFQRNGQTVYGEAIGITGRAISPSSTSSEEADLYDEAEPDYVPNVITIDASLFLEAFGRLPVLPSVCDDVELQEDDVLGGPPQYRIQLNSAYPLHYRVLDFDLILCIIE
jgi:hypothetical protein